MGVCAPSKLTAKPSPSAHCHHRSALLSALIRRRFALSSAHSNYALSLRSLSTSLQSIISDFIDTSESTAVISDRIIIDANSSSAASSLNTQEKPEDNTAANFINDKSETTTIVSDATTKVDSSAPNQEKAKDDTSSKSDDKSSASEIVKDDVSDSGEKSLVYSSCNQPMRSEVVLEKPPEVFEAQEFGYGSELYGGGMRDYGCFLPDVLDQKLGDDGVEMFSVPVSTTWDFLDPFAIYQDSSFYFSNSLRESFKEERIPIENASGEIACELCEDKDMEVKDEVICVADVDTANRNSIRSVSDVDVVEKSVVIEKEEKQTVVEPAVDRGHYADVLEMVKQIKLQFDIAAESVEQVSKLLEVGKIPYCEKNSVCKDLASVAFGLPFITCNSIDFLDSEEAKAMETANLSSALQELYNWEMKLLGEVKAEEKMHVLYNRKCQQLKHLAEKGGDAKKLEEIQTLISKLSTKMKISIQIINTISKKITKLQDEYLWPQISELLQGLVAMWHALSRCHQIQLQALSEVKNIDNIVSSAMLSDTHTGTVKQLLLELLEWRNNFSAWVAGQKNFVKCLNDWLLVGPRAGSKAADGGIPSVSPEKLCVQPMFSVCNSWSTIIDRISEREVADAIQTFASNIVILWEHHSVNHSERLSLNEDLGRALRQVEREEDPHSRKTLEKESKKFGLLGRENAMPLSQLMVVHNNFAEVGSLQLNLKKIFAAMENFASTSTKVYEELHILSKDLA